MKCTKCGKEYNETVKFCSVCGQNLENDIESYSFWEEDYKDKFNNTTKISEDLLKDINEQKVVYNYNDNIEENKEIKTINNIDIDREFYGKNFKNKKLNKFLLVIIIIIIFISLFGGLYYFLSKPKNTIMLSLYKYSSKIENNFFKDYYSISGNYNINYEIKDLSNNYQQYLDVFNNFALSGTYEIDFERKIANLELGSSYNDKDFINGNIYNEDNYYYLYSDKVYDKYLKVNIKDKINLYNRLDNQDYINVIDGVKEAFISSVKNDYIVKSKDKIDNIDVNKYNLKIDKNNYKEIVIGFLTKLNNNKKFINSINRITNKDIKKLINDFILDLNNKEFTNEINIYFYIKNISYDLVKLEINLSDNINQNIKLEIKENNIILIDNSNQNINKIKLTKLKDNNYILDITNKNINLKTYLGITTKYNKTINNKDITNSIDLDKLTKEDYLNIKNNLLKKEGISDFYEEFNSLYLIENKSK